ncbi:MULTISPECIES: hypothetical protein [Sulfolobaceae]|uniref:hypothetical protein n=1 Tax=Sulfolobaceae TaxID=118883 RepID=UPI0012EAEC5E|nr:MULTISPECIES: hypothetical protein [unclassified Sulfolobus]
MMEVIKISRETKEKLVKIAGKLQAERGEFERGYKFPLEFYESNNEHVINLVKPYLL